jgi:hypothetical protein
MELRADFSAEVIVSAQKLFTAIQLLEYVQ